MSFPAAPSSDCPCGCEQRVPQTSHNVWNHNTPYWEWICINATCEWRDQGYLNQTGDCICSMCGRKRVFVGHFDPIASRGKHGRVTVLGKYISRKHAASYFHKGAGLLDNEGAAGFHEALKEVPLGDDPMRGIT